MELLEGLGKLAFNLKIIPTNKDGILFAAAPYVPFIAMFNPESFAVAETLQWDGDCVPASGGSDPVFKGMRPRTFSLDILLDGTGVNTNGVKIPVVAQVVLFKQVTSTIIGTIHRPNYLVVQYGTFITNCVLNDFTVTYTMFDLMGLPIRAKINASFTERIVSGLIDKLTMFSSPDLTHRIKIKEWDILPLLTWDTYNNQQYYLQVAKVNRLKNFRKLEAGTELIFPPVSDKKNNT